jgi:hypothetical protein
MLVDCAECGNRILTEEALILIQEHFWICSDKCLLEFCRKNKMFRTRMDWDWAGKWPIFVYTTWFDNAIFYVKIVKGKYGDQNAPGYGPTAPAWKDYVQRGLRSKNDVVRQAFKIARREIKQGR